MAEAVKGKIDISKVGIDGECNMFQWINVKDKLPKVNQKVLIYEEKNGKGSYAIAHYSSFKKLGYKLGYKCGFTDKLRRGEYWIFAYVKYWMPLCPPEAVEV